MIKVEQLSKRYGDTLVVDSLSFDVQPGVVTGFLGPNGAGKSTTMRMMLGLDRPSAGRVTINGRRYQDIPAPPREIGAILDAKAVHGGRSAYAHLRWMAQSGGIPKHRVDEVLDQVGLSNVAGRRVGAFSLGMFQRLGLAGALLGDPHTVLLDEPLNGLDPEGIRWVRDLMKNLAGQGRTVFVSSHLMNEMEETAEHVLVIGKGRLIADVSIDELTQRSSHAHVRVVTPGARALTTFLRNQGVRVHADPDGALMVTGMESRTIGQLALNRRIPIYELTPVRASLEAAFMELTEDATQYRGNRI